MEPYRTEEQGQVFVKEGGGLMVAVIGLGELGFFGAILGFICYRSGSGVQGKNKL